MNILPGEPLESPWVNIKLQQQQNKNKKFFTEAKATMI